MAGKKEGYCTIDRKITHSSTSATGTAPPHYMTLIQDLCNKRDKYRDGDREPDRQYFLFLIFRRMRE